MISRKPGHSKWLGFLFLDPVFSGSSGTFPYYLCRCLIAACCSCLITTSSQTWCQLRPVDSYDTNPARWIKLERKYEDGTGKIGGWEVKAFTPSAVCLLTATTPLLADAYRARAGTGGAHSENHRKPSANIDLPRLESVTPASPAPSRSPDSRPARRG